TTGPTAGTRDGSSHRPPARRRSRRGGRRAGSPGTPLRCGSCGAVLVPRQAVADLEGDAPFRRSPRAVPHAWRPAGVHAGAEFLLEAEIDDGAAHDPDLLP